MYKTKLCHCCLRTAARLTPVLFTLLLGLAPPTPLQSQSSTFPLALSWSARDAGRADRAVWGDVDNDGDLDLLVVNEDTHLLLYQNLGSTLSFTPIWRSDACTKPISAAWGDVNGDGYLDLAVGACPAVENGGEVKRVRVFMNDKHGSLNPTPDWRSDEEGDLGSVAFADVDGDQYPELAVGNKAGSNYVYHNNGGVLATTAAMQTQDADVTYEVAWADVDGDGRLDLTTGNLGQSVRVYLNVAGQISPIGSQVTPPSYGGNPELTHRIAWADIDGDGDPDLAVANEGTCRIYSNSSTPGSITLTLVTTMGTPAYIGRGSSVAWGDADGDGDPDLAFGNFQSPSQLYLNQNGSLSTAPAWASDFDATTTVAWGDVDGDGDLDLAAANWGITRVYLNHDSILENQVGWSSTDPGGPYARDVAWGDVDKDGDLDLAVASYGQAAPGQPSRLYRNVDGQLVATPVWLARDTTRAMAVAWGDVNGDTFPDLAIASATQPSLVYYLNNGGSLSAQPAWESETSDILNALAWGDVDSDGDLDLAVAARGFVRVYTNSGGVLAKPAAWSQATTGEPSSVAWGDMDGDGDLDLAAGNWGFLSGPYLNAGAVYRNDAGILNNTPVWTSPPYEATSSVLWADMDGSGALDMVVGNKGQPDRVYTVTGGNVSTQPTWSSVEAESTWDIAIADADGNGYLDLLATSDVENWNRLYRNDQGVLTAVAAWKSADKGGTLAGAWGDIDNDGDLDLAAARYDGTHVYYNQRSELAKNSGTPTISIKLNSELWTAGNLASAKIWSAPVLPISYMLYHPDGRPVARIAAYYSLDGGGKWQPAVPTADTQTTDLSTSAYSTPSLAATHVYNWDIAASGVMGQSDNVVLRLVAVPSPVTQPNHVPGPFQQGAFATSTDTLPFRLRGTQVRVLFNNQPQSQALVYKLPARAERGGEALGGAAHPYRTDPQGYLQGRAVVEKDARLLALLPISQTNAYEVYYTSPIDPGSGMPLNTAGTSGVQTLTVSTENPLVLFNLDVALEWDASKDTQYLSQLQYDLGRASEFIYSWTNGQAALGRIRIYNDARRQPTVDGFQPWLNGHIRIYASNEIHPNAIQGGIVTGSIDDTPPSGKTIIYTPGMVHIGAVWNRYAQSGANLGEDWPRALAHELGHYLFFLDDNYIGQDNNGSVKFISSDPATGCPGAMNDPYTDFLTKFHPQPGWDAGCLETYSHQLLGRSDWATIIVHYPWLKSPATPIEQVNPGPSGLRLAYSQVTVLPPPDAPADQQTLAVPIFTISRSDGGAYQPSVGARAFLLQGLRLIDLGAPSLDQLVARGARSGDTLCLLETDKQRAGCLKTVPGVDQLVVYPVANWQPQVTFKPVTATSLTVAVTGVGAGRTLQAQMFPRNADTLPPITLAAQADGYTGSFQLSGDMFEGYLRIWDTQSPDQQQVVTDFVLGSNPRRWDAQNAQWRTRLARWRASMAPVISAGGKVSVLGDEVDFGSGDWLFSLQAATILPDVPPWAKVIGQGYWLHASPGSPDLSKTAINFVYDGSLISTEHESFLRIYFWQDGQWTGLPTEVIPQQNLAWTPTHGPGLYALFAAIEIPLQGPGWNIFSYSIGGEATVVDALKSIAGLYSIVFAYEPTNTADPWRAFRPSSSRLGQRSCETQVRQFVLAVRHAAYYALSGRG